MQKNHKSLPAAIILGAFLSSAGLSSTAIAKTYIYDAVCEGSYSKQGEIEQDLTKKKGRPISCDSVVLSFLDNGHVLFQLMEKSSHLTPLGFAGNKLDYDLNPNFVTMPLENIYLPHSDPGKPEFVGGVEGYCFLDGKLNIANLSGVSCTAKIEIGTQKLVYKINARITSVGKPVPGEVGEGGGGTGPITSNKPQSPDCASTIRLHGFLSRAQFQCGFNFYSNPGSVSVQISVF